MMPPNEMAMVVAKMAIPGINTERLCDIYKNKYIFTCDKYFLKLPTLSEAESAKHS